MPDNILTNRLAQPIPEKCPLSEAIVSLITGCLPVSLEDYKAINTPSIEWRGQVISTHTIDNSEGAFWAIGDRGQEIIIEHFELLATENKLLAALINGDIRAWGEVSDFRVKNPEKLDRINYHLTEIWDSYLTLNSPIPFGDNKVTEIKSTFWSGELVSWLDNILHSPLSCDHPAQFSDVIISTNDFFTKFGAHDLIKQLNRKECFWIPISQALSLIVTGKHNSPELGNSDILNVKEAELIRMLRNDKLCAEGHSGGVLEVIENTNWTMEADIHNDRTQGHYDIHVDENEIRALFNIPEIEDSKQIIQQKPKRGRPPNVEKELWLEELAVLFLTGIATKEDNIESLSSSLITSLSDNHNKDISLETVRKDWLRPIFKTKKERNGGK